MHRKSLKWLTLNEVVDQTGMPAKYLKRGIRVGLFDGYIRKIGNEIQFRPETVKLVNWSWRVNDAKTSGMLTDDEMQRLLRYRAKNLLHQADQVES